MDCSLLKENWQPRSEGHVAGRRGLFPDGTVPPSGLSAGRGSLLSRLRLTTSRNCGLPLRARGVKSAGAVPLRGKMLAAREAAGRGGILPLSLCLYPGARPRAAPPSRPPSRSGNRPGAARRSAAPRGEAGRGAEEWGRATHWPRPQGGLKRYRRSLRPGSRTPAALSPTASR